MSGKLLQESLLSSAEITEQKAIDSRLVWVMAIASGLAAANLYYGQPLLANMSREFAVSVNQIGFIATLMQLGYATGLLFIVPLGDSANRRKLIVGLLAAVTVALAAVAIAPSIVFLAIACFAVGALTIVAQLIIPFAANLAPPQMRGRIVGSVMSGLLIGILLARTLSGFVGEHLGWRMMYWIAAGMMVILALVLRFMLPQDPARPGKSYPQLLRSLWDLVRGEPILREASVFGGLVFAAFSVFWVALSFFLETPPYHYGSEVAGLFGLVGVAGASAASIVGRLADRMNPRYTVGMGIIITLLSFVLMWLTGQMLWGLIIGVILLDFGTQANQVSNQARIYSLRPEASNRLNTIYMVTYFIFGSLGSMLGAYGWSQAGWAGVCGAGILLLVAALLVYVLNSKNMNKTMNRS